jgi:hypothetical protein
MITIRRFYDRNVIHRGEFASVRQCLEDGVSNGIDFSFADLTGTELNGAKLNEADLEKADLAGADLSITDLTGANLTGADLSITDLTGANLTGADLHQVDLRGANLTGANLDLASFPLWCGGLGMKVDDRLFVQLLYHLLSFDTENCSEEIKNFQQSELFTRLANKFCTYRKDIQPNPQ